MSWDVDAWKKAHERPVVHDLTSHSDRVPGQVAHFVSMQGNEFAIRLTADDADELASHLAASARRVRAAEDVSATGRAGEGDRG